MSFGSQLVVLRRGRLIQSGSPSELYRAPADPVTAEFLGEAIILDAVVSNGVAECGLGRIAVVSDREGPATIMLRPEQIVLRPAGGEANGANVLARVLATDFAGASTRIKLDTTLGSTEGEGVTFVLKSPTARPAALDSTVGVEVLGRAHIFDRQRR